jgi:hypothetical protein
MKKRSYRNNDDIVTIKYIIISIILFFILCIILIQYFLHNSIENKETISITNHLRNINDIYSNKKDIHDINDYNQLINKV